MSATRSKNLETLSKYMPAAAAVIACDWIAKYNIKLTITPKRQTKRGDYRPPTDGGAHRITINHDLNQYSFLITFVHEVAHLTCWEKHRNRVKPHGEEWKKEFRALMLPLLGTDIFPQEVSKALGSYMTNPAASSCSDLHLDRTLRLHNKPDTEPKLTVEQVPHNSIFSLANGMHFRKGEKMRKRYKCLNIHSNRHYMVSPIAEIAAIHG